MYTPIVKQKQMALTNILEMSLSYCLATMTHLLLMLNNNGGPSWSSQLIAVMLTFTPLLASTPVQTHVSLG